MTESVTIVLPLPAKVLSPNCTIGTMRGRFMKAAATKRYRRITREAIENERIETLPWNMASVGASFYWKNKGRHDQDNASASLKAAYDGIVDAGLLEDDDYKHMKREPPVFLVDKENPRVELTITRREENARERISGESESGKVGLRHT